MPPATVIELAAAREKRLVARYRYAETILWTPPTLLGSAIRLALAAARRIARARQRVTPKR